MSLCYLCKTCIIIAVLAIFPAHALWFWEQPAEVKHVPRWTSQRKLTFREKTRDLWTHAFNNYMQHAYPMDELRPLSCKGRGPTYDDSNDWVVNDVAGNFSVTLIDALDTFVVMNDRRGFAQAVQNVLNAVHSFDLDTKPQVFETNIRVLGGLLSGHQFASNPNHNFHLKWYRGELLNLAYDLGLRLLPAFKTPTGIPYARINLRHGVLLQESTETCTAGAGSLIIEFGVLSRLTGDPRFEKAAYKAFFAIWNRRSDLGLVGNTINAWTGTWLSDTTGIGAGVDSFYEYALKWYILSGEVEFLDVWNEAYGNIMRYARGQEGYWFRQVNMRTGEMVYASTDSLSSFWSGLQVLAGDLQNAIKSHLIYWNIWRRFSGIPEVFDLNSRLPSAWQYPLRPEFIESTYFLYLATRDTLYLDVGERVLSDLILRSKVDCGLASIASLLTNKRDDRMESFVLSETLKYLYLLFDENNPLHSDDSNMIFTTEGHLLTLQRQHIKTPSPIRRKLRRAENLQCPAYNPTLYPWTSLSDQHGLTCSIRSREDAEFARLTVGSDEHSRASEDDSTFWMKEGWCESPHVDVYSWDFVFSADGSLAIEDPTPDKTKLHEVKDGYMITNMTGLRTHITSRLDGKGYDITKIGPFAVRTGQKVYVNDSALNFGLNSNNELHRDPEIRLRFRLDAKDIILPLESGLEAMGQEVTVTAFTSLFAGDPAIGLTNPQGHQTLRFSDMNPLQVLRPESSNGQGCSIYAEGSVHQDAVLLVERGECTFLQKLLMGKAAGAAGVIVASDTENPINPTAESSELEYATSDLSSVALVILSRSTARTVSDLLDSAYSHGVAVLMSVEHQEGSMSREEQGENWDGGAQNGQILYVNGRALINAELLV
ncbi:glycoside hydrolase family 47 protein [Ramaria rubella]|nr:glycoside hydrolase family 47 protein [Ramaria rubella]